MGGKYDLPLDCPACGEPIADRDDAIIHALSHPEVAFDG